ncbi:hypothetical protein [Micromonospora vulcania]|uniref:Uncharacterized protein n=1 Tax=Micromonospora vulcania TaxID=1441873 RepID=A0ABW1H059_9ACTN
MSQDQVAAMRSRTSYRLLVLAFRLVLLAAASVALTQVLAANALISHRVLVVVLVPLIVVALASFFTVIATLAIQAAHFSVTPLARGVTQRQSLFSRALVEDLMTLPWAPGALFKSR